MLLARWGAAALAGMAITLAAGGALAQTRPVVVPLPGYVTPPENSAGLYPISGEPIFRDKCATCHEPAVDRAPDRQQLNARSPEEVYDALTVGAMKPVGDAMTPAEIYGVVRFLTGKSPTPQTAQGPDPNVCRVHGPLQPAGPRWNGWGRDLANSRFQPNPGLNAADIPRLKVKWAFSYPGTKNTQPLVFGDRLFVASLAGKLYSLDAATACVHWRYDFRGGARASMSIGKHPDAASGYVPLSASEESQGNVATYNCCTFIGTVVALDARTGRPIWKQAILNEKPRPTRLNPAGTQMYGPAGGAIWSAPTIDAKRGQLYVATGDSYTEVDHPTSDAVLAMDLKTGKIRWTTQVLANDNFMSGTINGPLGERGPDYDFGSSPNLVRLANGRELVITGNKSSIVYAMDPDTGRMVWETPKLGSGGTSGGVEWSTATDGRRVYAPLVDSPTTGRPGLVALDTATGREVWRVDTPKDLPCNVPSGRCRPGISQAATVIPGAIFVGVLDGRLRAYATADGKPIWTFDTTTPRDTVNGVKQAPGGYLDMGGPVVAGGRLYVHSGYNGSAGANNLLLAFSVDGK